MRIVCPECGALYEIPDAAIPAPGRAVQCALCTNAWYQLSGIDRPVERPPRPRDEARPAPDDSETAPDDNSPPRREVDSEVLKILREEAAYESARRSEEGATARLAAADAPPHADEDEDEDVNAEPVAQNAPDVESLWEGHEPVPEAASASAGPVLRDSRIAKLRAAENAMAPLTPAPDPDITVERSHRDGAVAPIATQGDTAAALTRARAPREAPRNLPVRTTPAERSLAVQAQRRRGFRLGFAGTAGLTCAAVAVYLAAPHVASRLPQGTPFAEILVDHGDRVQAAIVALVRAPAGGTAP